LIVDTGAGPKFCPALAAIGDGARGERVWVRTSAAGDKGLDCCPSSGWEPGANEPPEYGWNCPTGGRVFGGAATFPLRNCWASAFVVNDLRTLVPSDVITSACQSLFRLRIGICHSVVTGSDFASVYAVLAKVIDFTVKPY
jgi:hypothetical protein